MNNNFTRIGVVMGLAYLAYRAGRALGDAWHSAPVPDVWPTSIRSDRRGAL